MSLSENEKLLLEAINNMLHSDTKLGLSMHDKDLEEAGKSRGFEYFHNQIDAMFHHKSAESNFADSLNQAFHKVHSYKYIDDPTFKTSMKKEMVAQGIPASERDSALKFVDDIIEELSEEQQEWAEKDYGFNPSIDEVMDLDSLEQPMDFEVEEVEDWPTEANVEWDKGNASPARTPFDKDIPNHEE